MTWKPLLLMFAIVLVALGCTANADETTKKKTTSTSTTRSTEIEVALSDVPEAVLAAAKKAVPGIKISSVEKETEGGEVIYDVEGVVDGKEYEVEVSAAGKVLEIEEEDDDDDEDDEEEEDDED